jgi:glycosyltransferase involved in cell wall biosynthesis
MGTTVVMVAYSAGGKGAVAGRVRADAETLAADGATVYLVTDMMRGERPAGVRLVRGRSWLHWLLPDLARELVAVLTVRVLVFFLRLRGVRPDAVVFHSSTLIGPCLRLARSTGALLVFVVHSLIQDRVDTGANPHGRLHTRWYARATVRALRDADRAACVSRHMAEVAAESPGCAAELLVVTNPLDLGQFAVPDGPRDTDVLYAGRLSVEKGVDLLVDAVEDLDGVRTVIAGDGPMETELRRRAGTRVEFTGWLPRSELAARYGRSRLLVVPSRSEPQGVVVLEAMACGTPVLGARTGGIPEMIDEGRTGWLFESGDAGALRKALVSALADPEALAEAGRAARAAVADYGLDRHLDRIRTAYLR